MRKHKLYNCPNFTIIFTATFMEYIMPFNFDFEQLWHFLNFRVTTDYSNPKLYIFSSIYIFA